VRYGKQTIVASGDTVTIDGQDTFDLAAVSAVVLYFYGRSVNGWYQGTDFYLRFKQDKRACFVVFSTDQSDENREMYMVSWQRLADRIYAIAIPRIADEIVARVRAGETVSYGALGGDKVQLTLAGVKKGGLFSKLVPWSQVTRTDMDKSKIRVFGRKAPGAEETVICGAYVGEWNVYALPTVVGLLKG
jgi:hypothetical protein